MNGTCKEDKRTEVDKRCFFKNHFLMNQILFVHKRTEEEQKKTATKMRSNLIKINNFDDD